MSELRGRALGVLLNSRIQQYNAQIPGIVNGLRATGQPVRMVSMSAVTTADMSDSLHPNNTGYRKMADAFDRAVTAAQAEGLIVPPVPGDTGPCVGESSPSPPSTTPTPPGWNWVGEIAPGVGTTRDQVRFADLNGDGRADYLVVGDQGQVRAWLNTGTGNSVAWTSQGGIASGIGAAGDTIRFEDVNGDRRDDYLMVGECGQIRAWLNNRGRLGLRVVFTGRDRLGRRLHPRHDGTGRDQRRPSRRLSGPRRPGRRPSMFQQRGGGWASTGQPIADAERPDPDPATG
ncbi:FG-GAP-like repeat-containing protein [Micromonospora sp. NPDC051925]|uniref:FG-GAP-like repeat-containing protein n=1 Tax=Micromonospora sp. NPDC051925 TaxID=3364288 RepID=UPI0037C81660